MEPSQGAIHPEQSGWEQTRGPEGLENKKGASENWMAQGLALPQLFRLGSGLWGLTRILPSS